MGRGHVEETETAMKEHLEVDAVAKSGNNLRVRTSGKRVGDPKVGARHLNEAFNNDCLGVKTPKQLMAHQPRKGVTEAGGEVPNRREG